jgi:hypothetical protein
MSVVIWKYPVPTATDFELEIPRRARILSVKTQRNMPQLWIMVDTEETVMVKARFLLLPTGLPIEGTVAEFQEKWEFGGTFQLDGGALVFHLFLARPEEA